MDSFIFALSAIAPIVLTVLIGYFLKRIGWMNESFAKAANKLVFRVFMPVMLFVKIYSMQDLSSIDLGFIGYAVISILAIFAVTVPLSILVARQKDRRGVLVQAAFRSGYSLIGIPLAQSLYGEAGAMAATILSAAVIPVFNVLAVISLTALGNENGEKPRVGKIVLDIIKNPLILGIAAALAAIGVRTVFGQVGIDFRLSDITPLFTVLQYLANLAIPLALLVLGAQFELSAVASLKREIIFGTLVRTVFVPLFTLSIAYHLRFGIRNPRGRSQRSYGAGNGRRRHPRRSACSVVNAGVGAHRILGDLPPASGRRVLKHIGNTAQL